MKKNIKNGCPELWITGVIVSDDDKPVYDWFGIESVSPGEFFDALPVSGPVSIKVDSPGGDLLAGASIYTALMQHDGPVAFEIIGLAASAASAITMASARPGNRCRMSPMALMMLHNVQTSAEGDYREMQRSAAFLQTANQTIVNAYCLKTGMNEERIQEMLDAETWLSAEEALKVGLIDEVMFWDEVAEETEAPPVGSAAAPFSAMVKRQAKSLMGTVPILTAQAKQAYQEGKAAAKEKTDYTVCVGAEQIKTARARIALERMRF